MNHYQSYAIVGAMIRSWLIAAFSLAAIQAASADETPDYLEAIRGRADKIVASLEVERKAVRERVRDLIFNQYRWLNQVHNKRDADIASIKGESIEPVLMEKRVLRVRETADAKIKVRHADFVKALSAELSPAQVDGVKDGMTYGVVQVTYGAYLKMLPELTDTQKKYIMAQLEEARDIAMDAGSSDEKHKWFRKYKGRINNYLSKAGYDLNAASKQLEEKH